MKHGFLKTIGVCSASLFLTTTLYAAPATGPATQQKTTNQIMAAQAQTGQSGQATASESQITKKKAKKAPKKAKKSVKHAAKKKASKPKATTGQ